MVINTKDDLKFVSAFKRSTAISLDMTIVLILRVIIAQILGAVWINKVILDTSLEFKQKFGDEINVQTNPEHLDFILHHSAFLQVVLFYLIIVLIGAFYHGYFNSSNWQATPGKRFMKIMIIKEDGKRISFVLGIVHYILSLLPFLFVLYIVSVQIHGQYTLFQVITHSVTTIILSVIFVLWVQLQIFTKRRTTLYDLICKVIFIEGKTHSKLPWSN